MLRKISSSGEDGLGRELKVKEFRKIGDTGKIQVAHVYCRKSKDAKSVSQTYYSD